MLDLRTESGRAARTSSSPTPTSCARAGDPASPTAWASATTRRRRSSPRSSTARCRASARTARCATCPATTSTSRRSPARSRHASRRRPRGPAAPGRRPRGRARSVRLLICAAWARRLSHRVPARRIDVAMADVVAWWVGPRTAAPCTYGSRRAAPPGSPGYGVFRAARRRWIALGVLGEPRLWAAICTALGPRRARRPALRRAPGPDRRGRRRGRRARRCTRPGRRARPAVRGGRAGHPGAHARGDDRAPADPGPGLPRRERRRDSSPGCRRGSPVASSISQPGFPASTSTRTDSAPATAEPRRSSPLRFRLTRQAPAAAPGAWQTFRCASSRMIRTSASCSIGCGSRLARPKPV